MSVCLPGHLFLICGELVCGKDMGIHSWPCYAWITSVRCLETTLLGHRRHFQEHEMIKGSFRLQSDLIYGYIDSFPSVNVPPWNKVSHKIQAIDLHTHTQSA